MLGVYDHLEVSKIHIIPHIPPHINLYADDTVVYVFHLTTQKCSGRQSDIGFNFLIWVSIIFLEKQIKY